MKLAWKDRKEQIKQAVSNILEIPKDIILDLPKITMVGNVLVYVENHRGIREYTDKRISIGVSLGELEILGEGLIIRAIVPEEITVEGKIFSLHFNP